MERKRFDLMNPSAIEAYGQNCMIQHVFIANLNTGVIMILSSFYRVYRKQLHYLSNVGTSPIFLYVQELYVKPDTGQYKF
jgi:hypothetical protein